jgi:hypothetical protein
VLNVSLVRAQLGRVRREAAGQLSALVARQEAVEANAPLLAEAVAAAKEQLRHLAISESVYEEIRMVRRSAASLENAPNAVADTVAVCPGTARVQISPHSRRSENCSACAPACAD